uniref:endonuclease domain-containing 1 protein-like n=1 Tax=Monopterus albus TaxID=43700 RepID=UPI0009B3EBEF|nr:endonuclease domain-containing 1 protein-like [Monopterus albus]
MQSLVTVCSLFLLIFSGRAHVVDDFTNECKEFFYKNFEPKGLGSENHAHICQSYSNNYYFATLYDTCNRIPVYSAYVYQPTTEAPQSSPWHLEPQLIDRTWDKNMMRIKEMKNTYKITTALIGKYQAVEDDYKNSGYSLGHLNPKGYHGGDASRATFTLTNVVPQNIKLNGQHWQQYENKLKTIFADCHKTYVLVGAVPSQDNWLKYNNANRVNIPDYMWQAYCCVDNNDVPIKSGAATARNDNNPVQECSLTSLKSFLHKFNQNREPPELFANCNAQTTTEGDCSAVIS